MPAFVPGSDQPYAHTTKDGLPWEPLFTPWHDRPDHDLPTDPQIACSGKNAAHCPHCQNLDPQHGHLNKVAHLASKFASEMLPDGSDRESVRQWAYLTGLWHDLGKFSDAYQNYLNTASDPHSDEIAQKTDHTTAGAKHCISSNPLGHLIATAIAGHHSGLLDARANGASLEKRLQKNFGKEIAKISPHPDALNFQVQPLPQFISQRAGQKDPNHDYSLAFYQRMLFSCLVDADFLATEAFMNPDQAKYRPKKSSDVFEQALSLLNKKIHSFGVPDPSNKVAQARASVVNDCAQAASQPAGMFTLTVPTGGGKTLSSLNFALRHALAHGHTRIIYVIPFTSIIEQNAAVFRDLLSPLGDDIVIEHHSNLSPDQEKKQTETSRLATENWDAPIIVTTSVQFYESLFAAKTSRARKIHNIANSIVILDEAQTLPVNYLKPCLRTLEELTTNYHTTAVLCTATQPAVAQSPDFPIGFSNSSEIISDTNKLFASLTRVNITYRGQLTDEALAKELSANNQTLCIVNTKHHARALYQFLPPDPEANFHLSTSMTPQHRMEVLKTIRQRLTDKLPVRLISTQLIEAGVDVDFPTVYRSMAGLDSIAQAAGRCNREGKLTQPGQVHIFHSEHPNSERFFAETASVGHEILDLHSADPLSTTAVQAYFNKYYYHQKSKWDHKNILSEFEYVGGNKLPCLFQYRTVADNFKLIENNQIPIIIPRTDEIKELIDQKLRNDTIPLHRKLLRALQHHTVQIYDNQFHKNHHQFESIRDGQFYLLICPETHYDDQYGLNLTDEAANSTNLIY